MPLPPGVRARRNKTSTRGTLRVIRGEEASTRKVPPLPPISVRNPETGRSTRVAWHPRVRAWWIDLWQRSDYVDGLLEHEVSGGLFVLARLYQRFWADGDAKAAQEIRLNEERLGLSPIARRRLQQEIDRGEEAAERTRRRRNQHVRAAGAEDPRAALDHETTKEPE
jgi:hypothetical protein